MHPIKLIAVLLLMVLLHACSKPHQWHATDISGAMPDLEFSLVGTEGQKVNARDLRGKPVVLFFGFTNCPHICPTILTQLAVVMGKLGQQADDVQVLLVTVDPDRDTPEVMKRFAASFGPWLTGLTGPEDALTTLRESFGVYAAMESSPDRGQYNVMHTTAVFVFDSNGRVRLLMSDVSNSEFVVADLKQLL